jgi:biotin operon repressor
MANTKTNKRKEQLQQQRIRRAKLKDELAKEKTGKEPSLTALARQFGISRATLKKDMAWLETLRVTAEANKNGGIGITPERLWNPVEVLAGKTKEYPKELFHYSDLKAQNKVLKEDVESIWNARRTLEIENRKLSRELEIANHNLKEGTKIAGFLTNCNSNQANKILELEKNLSELAEQNRSVMNGNAFKQMKEDNNMLLKCNEELQKRIVKIEGYRNDMQDRALKLFAIAQRQESREEKLIAVICCKELELKTANERVFRAFDVMCNAAERAAEL